MGDSDEGQARGRAEGSARLVHLVFRNEQEVGWFLDPQEALADAREAHAQGADPACGEVLSTRVDARVAMELAKLAPKIAAPSRHPSQSARRVEPKYYAACRRFLADPPEWRRKEGLRVFVAFDAGGGCHWSPSEANLASIIAKCPPGDFLGPPCRVELTEGQYVELHGYFEWACDNF